jgi:hypothetical protein
MSPPIPPTAALLANPMARKFAAGDVSAALERRLVRSRTTVAAPVTPARDGRRGAALGLAAAAVLNMPRDMLQLRANSEPHVSE